MPDTVIRPAVVAALNELLHGEEGQLLGDQVSICRQPCRQGQGALITMRVEGGPSVLRKLKGAVERMGALVMDWGRQGMVLATLQTGGDAAEAQVLVRVSCDGPVRPSALAAGMRHNGVDAQWAVRVDVPDVGQGKPRVINPWGDAGEAMAEPGEGVLGHVGRRDDSYVYLMLVGGGQASQQKLSQFVDASRGANKGARMGGDREVAADGKTLRVRVGRIAAPVPPLEGAQLVAPQPDPEQGPLPKRRAPGSYAAALSGVITAVSTGSGQLRRLQPTPPVDAPPEGRVATARDNTADVGGQPAGGGGGSAAAAMASATAVAGGGRAAWAGGEAAAEGAPADGGQVGGDGGAIAAATATAGGQPRAEGQVARAAEEAQAPEGAGRVGQAGGLAATPTRVAGGEDAGECMDAEDDRRGSLRERPEGGGEEEAGDGQRHKLLRAGPGVGRGDQADAGIPNAGQLPILQDAAHHAST